MNSTIKPLQPDWIQARENASSQKWARDFVAALEKDMVAWSRHSPIPSAEEPSGWTHNYFCSECGEPLLFDPEKPEEHLAAECGKIYSGEKYDGAWRTLAHNTNAVQMERCVILLRLGIQTELATREILKFARTYPSVYPSYHIHGHCAALAGRMLPQSLDEALWMVTFLRSLRWSGLTETLSPAERKAIDVMAEMVVELMRTGVEQLSISNITCWLLACTAECALWLEDEKLLNWCWNGPVGVAKQLTFGFDADGQWHEGSTHYHYYTLTALLAYFGVTGSAHLPNHLTAILEAAFLSPLELAYSDGRLPAYNDAWPSLTVTDNADLYEIARHLFSPPKMEAALGTIHSHVNSGKPRVYSRSFNPLFGYSNTRDLTSRASSAALLFSDGKAPQTTTPSLKSTLFPYSGIGILRNKKVRLSLRFGPYGGGHDHCDKLDVDVETAAGWQSLDLGTSGYGAEVTNRWQRAGAAHNTVMIDGAKQRGSAGRLLAWSETSISAEALSAYPGVALKRTLTLEDEA